MRFNHSKLKCFTLAFLLFFTLGVSNHVLANSVSLIFEEAKYRDIFQTLGELGDLNVFIDDSVVGQGSLKLTNTTIPEALNLVSELSGYVYRITEDNLLVGTKERLAEYEESEIRYIYTRYVSPQSVIPAINMVVAPEQIYAHPGSNLLVLSGATEKLNQAEQIINKLDQPSKLTMQDQRTILSILQQITQELHLDLIADPKLAEESIIVNAWQMDPWEILELLKDLTMVEIEVQDQTLIATKLDLQGQERIKVYRLNHMEPEAVANAISLVLAEDKIQIDDNSKSVMIKASDVAISEIDDFILAYDQPMPQVFMEVWIQEMSSDALQSLGVEWSKNFDGAVKRNSSGLTFFELDLEPWEISFVLKALEDEGKVRILASPKLATLSGQEATMFIGDRVPVVLADEEGRERLEFLESGINLRVLPRVADDGFITINVRPEASTFAFTAGRTYPEIRTREAETTIRVQDGQPVLIGGLLQEQETETVTKVPILGHLPLIGKLFTSTTKEIEQSEMNIFLIPRIVDGSEGLVSNSFFTTESEIKTRIQQISKKDKGLEYWVASYYARGWQLQAGLNKRIQSVGLGLGIQRYEQEYNIITDFAVYADSDVNVRLELNVPFSFDFSETKVGLSFGLPIKYQGLTIEPNVGLYKLDKDVIGRFGIRLLK